MADIAFQQQFRQEFIGAFEMTKTQLRETVVKEADVRGNQATFLVAGSGGAEAKTRGVDGKIPATKSDLNQYTCTLVEQHHKEIRTSFDILSSQGNIRDVMQRSAAAVINRAMDQQIIDELANATVNTGAAATASLNLVVRAKTILGNNKVRTEDGQLFGLVTPAFMGYLQTLKEFSSVDYVDMKALVGGDGGFSDGNRIARWMGINWITHSELDGAGTSNETCYIYHRDAIGHACHKEGASIVADYDEEDDYSFVRASFHAQAKILQNTGIVKIAHDGSALAAA